MKRRNAVIGSIAIVAALVAIPVFARPGGHALRGHRDGPGLFGHLKQLKEELALSAEQTGQIAGFYAEARAKNEESRKRMREMKSALHVLLANPDDIAGAQAALDQKATARRARTANLLSATSKALGVLTAEQRAKLSTIVAERRERRRGRR